MFFSVIIPNYNHGRFLEERINSVLNQSYQNFELIILDDCSTDNSKEIILKYQFHAKVKSIVFNEKNNGSPFKQWKKGIELAKADWIWIAESDDLADPEFLRSAFEILKVSHASACYCDSYVIDENSKILYKVSDIKNKFFETEKWSLAYEEDGINELNEYLKFMCTINNASSLVFKKELFKKVENKITSFRYYGDWFYYLNVALQTNICYTGRILCSCRTHSHNLVNDDMPVVESKEEYFRILQFLLELSQVTNKKELINFFCLHYLGWGWINHGPVKGLSILRIFFKIDRKLAFVVTPKIIWHKVSGKKIRKAYP